MKELSHKIAALYLGQKCENSAGSIYIVSNTDIYCFGEDVEPWRKLTLHLRKLDSITEGEVRDVFFASNDVKWEDARKHKPSDYSCLENWWGTQNEYFFEIKEIVLGDPNVWLYLLNKGFDLFGLIESGSAVEIKN